MSQLLKRLWVLLKWSMLALCLLVIVAAAEKNVFGYAWRSAQLFIQGSVTDEQVDARLSSIMARSPTNLDGSKTILAVGDIVSCPLPSNFTKDLTTLTSWFGLDAPLDHSCPSSGFLGPRAA